MFYAILKSISQNNSKVVVELKNDMELKGNLVNVDTNLNLVLSKPNFNEEDNVHQLKNTYNIFIRGNVIRYIHFDKKEINNENANLVGQYIEVLKIFLVNGGAIVFWNDNETFTYECNLFLEAAEFQGEISKTKVRFGGEHKGKKIMIPGDITQELEKNSQFGKFNKKENLMMENMVYSQNQQLIIITIIYFISWMQQAQCLFKGSKRPMN